ncbi:MAG: type II toxin-antitoxin system VapC family toxin [Spirochaetaceae bacterium]|nr:MAG: type II toxin-antitoxin system VapC family toxin [Spirochaetaceae bacterium]
MNTVLDTSALISFLRGEESGHAVKSILHANEALVPAICVYEMLAGVRSRKHKEDRSNLLDLVTIVPLDRIIAQRAADLFTKLRSQGITLDNEDLLVAATALTLSVPILTFNRRHFQNIPGVRLV